MTIHEILSFRGGPSDYENKGVNGAFKFGANIDIRKTIDSLSCKQALIDEGLISSASPSSSPSPSSSISYSPSLSESASPSTTPSPSASASPSSSQSPSASTSPSYSISPSPSGALTSIFKGLIRWWVKATDGYTYGFDNVGTIYRRDADAFYTIVYNDPDGAIKGAVEKPSSTGKIYLQWATDTKVKRKDLGGNPNWNDVETVASNLKSQDWHTMAQVGGAGLIANGPFIAQVGYDDSYSNESLDLIPGNLAKTLVERNGRIIIGTTRTLDNTRSVNGAIDSEIPMAQVGDNGELIFADMASSMPIKQFPGGGKVNPGGVCNEIDHVNFFEWDVSAISWLDKQSIGNMALFAVYGADEGRGGIYSYGRKNKNHPFVMNLEYQIDAVELGAITSVNGLVIVSYQDSDGNFGVKAVDPSTKAVAIYEGLDMRGRTKRSMNISNWKTAEIECDPLPDGSSIEFFYKLEKTGGWIQALNNRNEEKFRAKDEVKAVFNIGADARILEPRVLVTPAGNTSPQIRSIRVFSE